MAALFSAITPNVDSLIRIFPSATFLTVIYISSVPTFKKVYFNLQIVIFVYKSVTIYNTPAFMSTCACL